MPGGKSSRKASLLIRTDCGDEREWQSQMSNIANNISNNKEKLVTLIFMDDGKQRVAVQIAPEIF